MLRIYKTTFPPEMSGAQRNFIIEMLKAQRSRKEEVDVIREVEIIVETNLKQQN